jgi:rhodanese-related sulfurtransferase
MSHDPNTPTPHVHSPGFLALVEDARTRTRSMSIPDFIAMRDRGEAPLLVDVREDLEWAAGHPAGAIHMGKGVIERDIEGAVPDHATPMVFSCGGGFRSALVCDTLQKMGYTNCISLDGGWKGWLALGLPVEVPAPGGDTK